MNDFELIVPDLYIEILKINNLIQNITKQDNIE